MSLPLLHQFRFSHFNEKARWALDHKHIAHRRRSYLPGLHIVPVLLASWQRQVPVLRDGAAVVAGSAAIVDHLERTRPDHPLYPADPSERAKGLDIQTWFDAHVGAPMRAAFFFSALDDPAYMASVFTHHAGRAVHGIYRGAFPAIAAIMRRDMKLTPAAAEEGLARTREGLDFVAANARPSGYLVGDRFSIADLAAAAILSPAVLPPEFPYPCPQPYSPAFVEWLGRWHDHPGTAWVREMYRRERGAYAPP